MPPPHATSTLKPVHFIETQALGNRLFLPDEAIIIIQLYVAGIHQTRKTPRSHDGTDDSSWFAHNLALIITISGHSYECIHPHL